LCNQPVELALLIHFCRDRHAILSAHCLRAFDGLRRYRDQCGLEDFEFNVDNFPPAHRVGRYANLLFLPI